MKKSEALAMIDLLTEAAARLEVSVRQERLQGAGGIPVHGGLARVEDNWVVFLEKRQTPQEKLDILIDALDGFDLSGLDLPGEVKDFFVKRRSEAG